MHQSYSRGYWDGGPQQQRRQQQQPRHEEEKEEKQQQQQHQHHPYLASSLFESNAFYNLGRVLSMEHQHQQQQQHQQQEEQQGGGDTEGEVHHRGYQYHQYQNLNLNGLADSAPVPPVQRVTAGWGCWGGGAGHEEQHGQGEIVEERDGSYLVCSIRPQDVPHLGALPPPSYFQTDEQELATQEQEASCRSVCDHLSLLRLPPSLLPSLPSFSSLSPSFSPFNISPEAHLPHRGRGGGREGGASTASLTSVQLGGNRLLQGPPDIPSVADFLRDVIPPSSSFSFSPPRPSSPPSLFPSSASSSSPSSSVISLDNFRVLYRSLAHFLHPFLHPSLASGSNLEGGREGGKARLWKEGGCCFLLGVALGCVLCVSLLLAPAGREGGRGGIEAGLLRTATTGRRSFFPALGDIRDVLCISSPSSPSSPPSSSPASGGLLGHLIKGWEHSSKAPQHLPFAFLPAPSIAATATSSDDDNNLSSSNSKKRLPSPPSSPPSSLSLSLGGHRKSQHIISKPVLTSPSSSPSTPSSFPSSARPSFPGGFRALLESYLWAERAKEEGGEGREGEREIGREGEAAGGEEGQGRFTLPNGKVLVATVKGATREAWHIISSSICSFIFLLLRRLPFVPPQVGRRHWGKGGKEEGKVE